VANQRDEWSIPSGARFCPLCRPSATAWRASWGRRGRSRIARSAGTAQREMEAASARLAHFSGADCALPLSQRGGAAGRRLSHRSLGFQTVDAQASSLRPRHRCCLNSTRQAAQLIWRAFSMGSRTGSPERDAAAQAKPQRPGPAGLSLSGGVSGLELQALRWINDRLIQDGAEFCP